MKKPHKHADIIKAWADGEIIEQLETSGDVSSWRPLAETYPGWYEHVQYRVKPTPTKEISLYGRIANTRMFTHVNRHTFTEKDHGKCFDSESIISGLFSEKDYKGVNNLELVFDGNTGHLIKANVIDIRNVNID